MLKRGPTELIGLLLRAEGSDREAVIEATQRRAVICTAKRRDGAPCRGRVVTDSGETTCTFHRY